jgi:hypothetical protein
LLAQAAEAETELRVEAAMDRLYALVITQPRSADVPLARIRLARLLALTGELPRAVLQCQLVRQDPAADAALRSQALDLGTVLARRLRAGPSPASLYFPTFEPLAARGVQSLDRPRTIEFAGEGWFALFDEGAGRVYRVSGEGATMVPAPQDPSAVALLRDGTIAIAAKPGLVAGPAARAVLLGGTWAGKARQAKKVESMAALPDGSLLALDNDFDGVLRCQPSTGACTPWGPAGKYRVVRVGPTGWVYLLDDKGQSVRVLALSQRQLAVVGPMLGSARLEGIEDIAVDGAHGLYLLDTKLQRVLLTHVQSRPDGRIDVVLSAAIAVPRDGDRALKNPSAIGVSPDGGLYIAGRSPSRIMRFR